MNQEHKTKYKKTGLFALSKKKDWERKNALIQKMRTKLNDQMKMVLTRLDRLRTKTRNAPSYNNI